ncbi:MAG: CRISPR-associated protein Csn2-St, partial [Candidatus Saccharibacteria bacterium]|nr:CRISPR-associated protein Csn2-St [Candidatus Saccharibacteria bacterium]
MKFKFTHPYKENLSIQFGDFTQIVGEDQQLKYYIWQLLIWYFDGKKYNAEDLSFFEQREPEILVDDVVMKRTEYKIIAISDIQDLIEQMNYKKGTIAFDFMKSKLNNLEVMEQIDAINVKLDQISNIVNKELNLKIGEVAYHTESHYFNTEQLILKNFLPYFGVNEKNISFEFIDNEIKFMIFLKMLEEILCRNAMNRLMLVLRNMSDYLTYNSFVK